MERVDIKIGFQCNNSCQFCVQGDKRFKYGNKTAIEIKNSLIKAKKDGATGLVFTGGEPTLHPDLIKSVSFAKKLGFSNIQIQSNGRMFAYLDYCKKLISAGANEFSPALHGSKPEIHDRLTNAPGSWQQVVKGVKNLKSLNQYVLTNTVINTLNYKDLPDLAKLFVRLGVDQFQFAFLHIIGSAWTNRNGLIPKVSAVMPYVNKGLDIGINAGKRVMTEAIPFCLMLGYEKYIAESVIPETRVVDAEEVIESYSDYRWEKGKVKSEKCQQCKYFKICEGPWKEYPEIFGWDEFKPVHKIADDFVEIKFRDKKLVEKISSQYNLGKLVAIYKYVKHSCNNLHVFIFESKKVAVKFNKKIKSTDALREFNAINLFNEYFSFPALFTNNLNLPYLKYQGGIIRVYEYVEGERASLIDNLDTLIQFIKFCRSEKDLLNKLLANKVGSSAKVLGKIVAGFFIKLKTLKSQEILDDYSGFYQQNLSRIHDYVNNNDEERILYHKLELIEGEKKVYLLESEHLGREYYPLTYALSKYLSDLVLDNLSVESLDILRCIKKIAAGINLEIDQNRFILIKFFLMGRLIISLDDKKLYNAETLIIINDYYQQIRDLSWKNYESQG